MEQQRMNWREFLREVWIAIRCLWRHDLEVVEQWGQKEGRYGRFVSGCVCKRCGHHGIYIMPGHLAAQPRFVQLAQAWLAEQDPDCDDLRPRIA